MIPRYRYRYKRIYLEYYRQQCENLTKLLNYSDKEQMHILSPFFFLAFSFHVSPSHRRFSISHARAPAPSHARNASSQLRQFSSSSQYHRLRVYEPRHNPPPPITMQPSIQRLLLTLLGLLSLVSASDITATLTAWPLSAANPTPLGSVVYNPLTLTTSTTSLKPLSLKDDELVRIGSGDGESWTVTTAGALANGKLVLQLDAEGRVYQVEVEQGRSAPEGIVGTEVKLSRVVKGATPTLSKPVVLNAQGRVPEVEKEKTFLQK
jgi:hypothetical protein